MASVLIHLAVAKKVLEKTKTKNEKDYYLGAIAPDLSKQIGESRDISHFQINTKKDIPNIKLFIKRYPLYKYTSFDLGYFTHLYTDKKWHEDIQPKIISGNLIKLLDGTVVEATEEEIKRMLYSDFTNLNIKLIEDYDLDLSLFYEDFVPPKTKIKEVSINHLDILINKMGILIENSKEEKTYTLDIEPIKQFINETAEEIQNELKKY